MRSAEGRRVPFAKGQGDAHVGGDAPHGVLGTGRHSALRPLGLPKGQKPAGQAGNTTASRGAELGRGRFRMAV